jgi:hypothetical protein
MERRPLKVGMNAVPNADPEEVRRFVVAEPRTHAARPTDDSEPAVQIPNRQPRAGMRGVTPVGLIPITVRLRPEIAGALKRASLERQLTGEAIFTQQELVETALEPWLRKNGYLA